MSDFEWDIVTACLKEGLLINCTMDNVLRLMPPLIVSTEEIDQLTMPGNDILKTLITADPLFF
jgi:acetylornithine/succinyldiaminopimelate/putrescine aminotransferase